jgi:hypothetical protein
MKYHSIMKRIFVLLFLAFIVSVFFPGCEKKGDPPALPSIETMKIDFSNFALDSKSAVNEIYSKGVENSNWSFAATVAGLWNTILIYNIAVPVAAFNLAVEHKPVYLSDKKWEWRYSVNAVSSTYNARLTGQIRDNDVKWEMYIEKEGVGGFGEFLWFEGSSDLDGKSGQWILNYSSQFPEPMLRIDWTWDGEKIGSIKYTYIRELNDDRNDEPFKDSFIEYGLTSNTLDAYYDVHFYESIVLNTFVDVNIEWSTTAYNGRVKAFYHYQDNEWHCWDSNGNDAECPQ